MTPLRFTAFLAASAALALFATTTWGQDPSPCDAPRGGASASAPACLPASDVLQELGATADQIETIAELRQDAQPELQRLQAEGRKAQLELKTLMRSPEVTQAAAFAAVDALHAARAAVNKRQVETCLSIQSLLGAEITAKLHSRLSEAAAAPAGNRGPKRGAGGACGDCGDEGLRGGAQKRQGAGCGSDN